MRSNIHFTIISQNHYLKTGILRGRVSTTGNQVLIYTIPELWHELDRDFNIIELNDALKTCRLFSVDNDMLHVTMLKKPGSQHKTSMALAFQQMLDHIHMALEHI